MKQGFSDYLEGYVRRYPNFHILGPLFWIYPDTDFIDSEHLRAAGAMRCTDEVASGLNQNRVPGGPFGTH
jgi:hypothetical protein